MSRFIASVGFSPTRWNGARKMPNFMPRWAICVFSDIVGDHRATYGGGSQVAPAVAALHGKQIAWEESMRLEGKVAIISGAASGMGAATARRFAKEGAKVVIADMLEEDGRQVAAEITRNNGAA